jgi:hypothetical protein
MCEAWHACQEGVFKFFLLLCVCTWLGGTFSGGRENEEITAGKNEFEYTTCWLMVCTGCGLYNSTNQCWLVCGC